MKTLLPILKILLLLTVNTVPFAVRVFFYRRGAPLDLATFPFVFGVLTYINYRFVYKTVTYALVQSYVLVLMACSGGISTHLYYINVSSDAMTPAIGMLGVYTGAFVIAAVTVITGTVKYKHNKQITENDT